MSIRIYSGEYLIIPQPLHIDLNTCLNNCSYCFAHNRTVKYDHRNLINQVSNRENPKKSLEKWFLKNGFPVLISNTTDPFSGNNRESTRKITEYLYQNNIPVCFQTKNSDPLLFCIPKTSIYITITTDNEKIRKFHEPKADGIEKRIEFAKKCLDYGHYVEIGINPFIPEWWNDIIGFIDMMVSNGLKRFVISPVHLSIHNKTDERISASFVKKARKRNKSESRYIKQLTNYIEPNGGRVDHLTDYNLSLTDSNFSEYYSKTGHKWLPTIHEFFHTLEIKRLEHKKPVLFTVEDFTKWAYVGLDIECSSYNQYLNNWGRSSRNKGDIQKPRSFNDVHKFLFKVDEYNTQFRDDRIYIATENGKREFDDGGNLMLVYDKRSQEIYREIKHCRGFYD